MNSSANRGARNEWIGAIKTVGVGLLLAWGLRTFVGEVCYIPSDSMQPTLWAGDRLIVEKWVYDIHAPQRGDIVVFHAPPVLVAQGIHDDLIKRVIGLPGDVVAVTHGSVFINGQRWLEPYVETSADYNMGPLTIPLGHYLVLGDNRNHSYDSHDWGLLPAANIVGRAWLRFYPLGRLRLF
ncbi:MAG TPA: signal peptidase I [Chroococcidiopsis sp.]